MFSKILNFVIARKALAAAVASAVGSYIIQNGLSAHQILSVHGIQSLVVGVVAHQFTYWVSMEQPAE